MPSHGLGVTEKKVFQIRFMFSPRNGHRRYFDKYMPFVYCSIFCSVSHFNLMGNGLYAASSPLGYQLFGLYHFHYSL